LSFVAFVKQFEVDGSHGGNPFVTQLVSGRRRRASWRYTVKRGSWLVYRHYKPIGLG